MAATKKKVETVETVDETVEEKKVEKNVEKKAEKKPNLVPVRLFKDNGKYSDDVKVGINGRMYVIKRGETVMVPREVKEILDHSEFQDTQTANMISSMEDEYLSKEKAFN